MSDAPPAVTAVLLSHNCAGFIADALKSVLVQDCEPMEIIVEDRSTCARR